MDDQETQVCLYPGCEEPMRRSGLCLTHIKKLVHGSNDEKLLAQDCVRTWHATHSDGQVASAPAAKTERMKPMFDADKPKPEAKPEPESKPAADSCLACRQRPAKMRGVCSTCYAYVRNHRGEDANERVAKIAAAMLPSKTTGRRAATPKAPVQAVPAAPLKMAKPDRRYRAAGKKKAVAAPPTTKPTGAVDVFDLVHRLCRGLGLAGSTRPGELVVMSPDKSRCVAVTADGELRTYHETTA